MKKKSGSSWVRRILVYGLLAIGALLLLVRWVGSPIVTAQVNRKLAALPQYSGRVEAIQLALWRGTVTARNFELFDRGDTKGGAVVKLHHAMLSMAWGPLFKGRIGGEGELSGVAVRMTRVATEKPPGTEKPEKNKTASPPVTREWQNVLQTAFPIEISRFEIKDAAVLFEDQTTQPVASFAVDQIHLVATDLSNRPQGSADLPAKVVLQARLGGTGKLKVETRADPSAPQIRFETKMEIKDLGLVPIHDFLAAFALIDVSGGTFELFSEVKAADGHYDGYVKPFFKDLQFKAVPDPNKNFIQHAATKVASAVTDMLKNDRDQIATKVPFKGDFADNKVEVWTAVENLLRNAFVQALAEGLEGQTPGGK